MDKLLEELYGTSKVKKTVFAESAAQLQLEASPANGHAVPSAALAVPLASVPAQPSGLAARLLPTGGSAEGFGLPQLPQRLLNGNGPARATQLADSEQRPAPRRINAQPVTQQQPSSSTPAAPAAAQGVQPSTAAMPPPAPQLQNREASLAQAGNAVGAKRKAAVVAGEGGGTLAPSKRVTPHRVDAGVSSPAQRQLSLTGGPLPLDTAARPAVRSWLPLPDPATRIAAQLQPADSSGGQERITLEAANDLAAGVTRASAQIVCSCSGKQLWTDLVCGCVVQLSGNQHFLAAGLLDGTLLVSTSSGSV